MDFKFFEFINSDLEGSDIH